MYIYHTSVGSLYIVWYRMVYVCFHVVAFQCLCLALAYSIPGLFEGHLRWAIARGSDPVMSNPVNVPEAPPEYPQVANWPDSLPVVVQRC